MSNLLFSLNGTVPIFAVMVVGYLLKRRGLFTEEFVAIVNRYVFRIALPLMIFQDLWTADILTDFDLRFVAFCFLSTVACFVLVWLGAEIFIKDKTMIGSFVQGSFRSSVAVLGLAFIRNMYGEVGLAPLMIVAAVPFYNIGSVVALTFRNKLPANRNTDLSGGMSAIKKACINIIKNPIIIGIVTGCAASLIHLKLPVMVAKTIDLIQQTSTPLALLAIGAGFEFKAAKEKTLPATAATAIKLVVQPLIFIPFAMWMGFRNQEMLAILIMLASPATASGYIMAREMKGDAVLSSFIIVLSTLFSAFTLTLWIFLLRNLGYLG